MPFLEILAFRPVAGTQAKAAAAMTIALSDAYQISPGIVSTYFVPLPDDGYAHAGISEEAIENRRVFIKIHGFRRPREKRRAAALGLTMALAEAYGLRPELVAVYFLDRDPGDVAHGGTLVDD